MLYREKPIVPAIAIELREIRSAWCLSREDLSERAKVGYGTLRKLETGERNPTLEVLMRWAGALGYEIVLRAKGEV